ncbi:ATP synthase subunit I [Pinisolibacter aquiterrae]|uniref:N-ATPase subunit AtpR n=1 Tax=Pinisolibacter aquiterrae TaxID=2815579 RepID=UPI001C3D87E2|nr:ATP synthase subunit I [Pinisolibacter aquiterrae]MBV5265835.1 hypothetical protein [Pinisolibacter aquiterrae]MCC8236600.1 hypothetical protein [Pinisolibacter aquiterrae]
MTDLATTSSLLDAVRASPALGGAIGAAVGFCLGLAYFGSLWWNAHAWAGGDLVRAAIVQILRFAVVAAVFYGLSRLGAAPLLGGALALLAARTLALRRFGRMP